MNRKDLELSACLDSILICLFEKEELVNLGEYFFTKNNKPATTPTVMISVANAFISGSSNKSNL
jgi:hypothetical protein